jgi:hypothetical protein
MLSRKVDCTVFMVTVTSCGPLAFTVSIAASSEAEVPILR